MEVTLHRDLGVKRSRNKWAPHAVWVPYTKTCQDTNKTCSRHGASIRFWLGSVIKKDGCYPNLAFKKRGRMALSILKQEDWCGLLSWSSCRSHKYAFVGFNNENINEQVQIRAPGRLSYFINQYTCKIQNDVFCRMPPIIWKIHISRSQNTIEFDK